MLEKVVKRFAIIAISICVLTFVFLKADSAQFVTYRVDQANSCIWKDGKIFSKTKAVEVFVNKNIKHADVDAFLAQSQQDGVCVEKI